MIKKRNREIVIPLFVRWTEKLLKTGMQVFAYVDRRSLTYNDVFSIVRGIEEYNTLIQLVRVNTQEMCLTSQKYSHRGKTTALVKLSMIGIIIMNRNGNFCKGT